MNDKCEICGSTDGVEMTVTAVKANGDEYYELICAKCRPEVEIQYED